MSREKLASNSERVPSDSRWKQIKEFPNYWISNYGHIIDLKWGKLVKILYDEHNLASVKLVDKSGRRRERSRLKLYKKYFGDDNGSQDR